MSGNVPLCHGKGFQVTEKRTPTDAGMRFSEEVGGGHILKSGCASPWPAACFPWTPSFHAAPRFHPGIGQSKR